MKKEIVKVLFFFIVLLGFSTSVDAASLSISANRTTTTPGGKISITVKANDLVGKFSITSSNGKVLSGGTSSVWLEDESKTYQFSAKSLGSATIKITPIDVSDLNGNPYKTSKSITLKVVAPREKSNNNNLKSLSVEGYQISPSFNKDKTNYTLDLPASVTKIKVNAQKENSYAKVNGSGEIEVKEGENKIEVVVTSETGSKKTYTIIATVKDENPIIVKVEDKDYTLIKRKDTLTKPEGFTDATVKIEEVDIPAFTKEENNLVLVGLKDKEGLIKLFIYNEEDKSYMPYRSLDNKTFTIYQKKASNIPSSWKSSNIKIGEETFTCYNENKDYAYLYGENLETKESGWYRYSKKDNTIQYEVLKEEKQEVKEETTDKKDILIVTLGGLSLVLALSLIVVSAKKKKRKRKVIKEPKEL